MANVQIQKQVRSNDEARALLKEIERCSSIKPTTYIQGVYIALRWLLSEDELPFDQGMEAAVNWMRQENAPRPEIGYTPPKTVSKEKA